MGLLLYNIFLFAYSIGIRLAAAWNPKAKRWVAGRRTFPALTNSQGKKLVWMHCASLGEFEQGRPLIEMIRNDERFNGAGYTIVVSFFSSSGYEVMKDYPLADHVIYLPLDSPSNARKLVNQLKPTLVLWIKYEFWHYYLRELKKQDIPVYLISGIFRSSQPFFAWYGKFWKEMLLNFRLLYVQNSRSARLLNKMNPDLPVEVCGDTRFDRVITIAEQRKTLQGIKEFCGDATVIVAGSTWEQDEAEWVHYIKVNRHLRFIIAPHEIDKLNLMDVKQSFAGSILYSDWLSLLSKNLEQPGASNVLIIDNMGMLSALYSFATVAYVGGGFGKDGVHNVLEAAVYGIPVLHGPVYEKYAEAVDLVDAGGSFVINNALELEKTLNQLLTERSLLKLKGDAARQYVYSHAGATRKIIDELYANRLLTN